MEKFEELNITLMSLIQKFDGYIYMDNAFHLLPITRVELERKTRSDGSYRENARCTLPHEKPGSIISLRKRIRGVPMWRGIIRNKKCPFKNSITLDMSISHKNLSVKFSSNSIRICGAKSFNDCKEVTDYLFGYLHQIQSYLNIIQEDPERYQRCVQWLENHCRGTKVNRQRVDNMQTENLTLIIHKNVTDYHILSPTVILPDELITFFLTFSCEFEYFSDYMKKIHYINKIKEVITSDITLHPIYSIMVNYNYKLPFHVDRFALMQMVNAEDNDFIAYYHNDIQNQVSVQLPYNQKGKISFLIYEKGSVTLTGPGGDIMKTAYYSFMDMINRNRKLITNHTLIAE